MNTGVLFLEETDSRSEIYLCIVSSTVLLPMQSIEKVWTKQKKKVQTIVLNIQKLYYIFVNLFHE